ncbi:hypothetical protein EQG73_11760 [Clostridium tetani]|nr:hypothetical protein EQG73_11760 [Clostridium tetani]
MNKQVCNEETVICEQKKKMYNLSIVMFWGAIWGFMEATVGYALHMLPFRVPTGSIFFPIGYYFMQKSYKETKDLKSMFHTAAIGASIKLINLFIPGTPVSKVINPTACILLEGLSVTLVFKLLKHREKAMKFIHTLIMSLSWRVGYYIVCFAITIPLGLMKSSSVVNKSRFIEFFFVNGFINSLIIYAYIKILSQIPGKTDKERVIKYNPIISTCLFVFVLVVQWLI